MNDIKNDFINYVITKHKADIKRELMCKVGDYINPIKVGDLIECTGKVVGFTSSPSYIRFHVELNNGSIIEIDQNDLKKVGNGVYNNSGYHTGYYLKDVDSITVKECDILRGKRADMMLFDDFGDDMINMPKIKNYTYIPETGTTIIEWFDFTKTVTKAENLETADQLTGFMTAYAKKAAGNNNKINDLFDYWTVKKPAKAAEEKLKQDALNKEIERIKAKKKAKKERWAIRKRAKAIIMEQEAQKLAQEMMSKKSSGEVESN